MTSEQPFPQGQSPALAPRHRRGHRPGAFALQVGPLLDRGMRIYRQHFLSFMAAGLLWTVPPGLLVGLRVVARGAALAAVPDTLAGLLVCLTIGLLVLGLIDILSRLAAEADSAGSPSWRQACQVRPLRLLSMLALTVVYLMGALLLFVLVSCSVAVLVDALGNLLSALFGGAGSHGRLLMALLVGLGLSVLGVAFALMLVAGLCYALQPLIQDDGSLWRAARAGLGGVFRPLAANLRLFIGAGLTASGFAFSVLLGIFGLASVPGLIFEPDLAAQPWASVLLALLLLCTLISLPPLPIWMAVAYRQRHGPAQLEQRITQLLAASARQPAPAGAAVGAGSDAPPA